jgi:hypothetical protein
MATIPPSESAGGGFSVLDGAAIVMGTAAASILVRGLIRDNLAPPGWALIWGTFAWVGLTASGPFLLLVRRFLRRLSDYPKVGDVLWAVLGTPWLLAAALLSAMPAASARRDSPFVLVLAAGVALAAFVALAVVWKRWVAVAPDEAARTASAPWTNRVGLVLAVAWPIQCGISLVLIEGNTRP